LVLVTVKLAAWASPVAAGLRLSVTSAAKSPATIVRMPAALSVFARTIFATPTLG